MAGTLVREDVGGLPMSEDWMRRCGRTLPREFSGADAVAMLKQRVQAARAQGAATLEPRPSAKQVAQAWRAA